MRRHLSLAVATLALLGGCSSGGTTNQSGPGASGPSSSGQSSSGQSAAGPSAAGASGAAPGADPACSGGLKGGEPGVVSVTCDGPAVIKIQAGGVTKEFHGGRCQSAGDIWSASVGVIIDRSGVHGQYAGPPVDNVTVNNTDTAGKATIQAALGGKLYYDLGTASLSLSSDRHTAHLAGTSDQLSDAPGAKIVVDVTC